jgi:hypothetical protein
LSVSVTESQENGAAAEQPRLSEPGMGGREYPAESVLLPGGTDRVQPTRPLGFWLVLASLLVVAAIYSVTMLTIGAEIRNPATAIGAMTATFAVIGTLVGTYFGIKAGLDGQDKVKETLTRDLGGAMERPQPGTERNGGRRRGEQPEEQRRGTRERGERRLVEPEERQDWEGVGV